MLAAALLALAACSLVSDADLAARFDADGDGVSRPEDCDDGDAALGAAIVWYADGDGDGFGATASTPACAQPDGYVAANGDCDDQEPGLNPATWWYPDVDGDTYGAADAGVQQCELPAGFIANGQDCLDSDPAAFPGGTDAWYDGVDGNCDGASDYDADGDGFDSDAYAGSDCDDTTDTIGPGVPEVCSNRIDDDCDGVIANTCAFDGDVTLDLADVVWTPVDDVGDYSPYIGQALAGGDLLGSGTLQVVLGAPKAKGASGQAPSGAVFVVPPTVGGFLDDVASAIVRGDEVGGSFGIALAIADLSGDGQDDLIVGSSGANGGYGEVAVLFGPLDGRIDAGSAEAAIAGESEDWYFGSTVEALGDIDGDGFEDAIAQGSLAATLLYGGRAAWDLSDGVRGTFGPGVPSGKGDVDGDGLNDILLSTGGRGSYYPVVFTHAPRGWESFEDDADARLVDGNNNGVYDALEILPDTNRDGYDDIVVGASGDRRAGANTGAALLFLGPPTGWADALIAGDTDTQTVGTSVTGTDIDADGRTDLVVGAPSGLYLFLSPISGTLTVADRQASITDAQINAREARNPGDLDEDGSDDLLIGMSSAYLFLGGIE
ncbi:hypothetical protein LBMAG42_07280 [Deltaproteobacteria bacterium]|nr:hypothetical protein LBMAG42_07280 [Deltaproteobacteria bacterium]